MQRSSRTAPATALLVGVAAVLAAVPLIGYSMAVVAPAGFLDPLKDSTSAKFASFIWDLLAVFGPTVGLLVFVGALAIRWIYGRPGGLASVSLAGGALLALYALVPFVYSEPQVRPLPWWASAAEASIIVACLAAHTLFRRRSA